LILGKELAQPIARHGSVHLSSKSTQEAEIGSIKVSGHSKQKRLQDPFSIEKGWVCGMHLPSLLQL
jgi:hypothetical protein